VAAGGAALAHPEPVPCRPEVGVKVKAREANPPRHVPGIVQRARAFGKGRTKPGSNWTELLVLNRLGAGEHLQRVDRAVIDPHLEVGMRSGRVARRADQADQLATLDLVAFLDPDGEEVTVKGL